MKSHAQVVVIGGGVVGASVAYHLTKGGWKDVVLIERSELTSGSTWHAAGGMHTLNGDPNVAKLQQYTINLYKEIEAISGVSCGMHVTGGLNLAGTKERLDWLKMAQRARPLSRHEPRDPRRSTKRRRCTPSSRRSISSARCTIRSKAISIPGASRRPTPNARRWPAPRSSASTASST